MLSAICYLPSVRLSVTRADQSKTVEVRIIKFSPYGSPIPLVFVGKFQLEILMGFLPSGASNKGGWKNQPFSSFKRQYLKNGRAKVTIDD